MLQIFEIVRKTEEMFDLFNRHFYGGELTRPAITVSPDGGRGAYGWCSVYEIWKDRDEAFREINICPSTSTGPSQRWQQPCSTRWHTSTISPMGFRT